MRSYYSHLEKLDPDKKAIKAIHRSSAIFPVFQDEKIQTRLIFLGYWLLKRNITDILAKVTVRNQKGQIAGKKNFTIVEPKAYSIEVYDIAKGPLMGSIEIEFHSETDLVFPYPAVTVNYYGKQYSTVVHTAERIYNDAEDAKKTSETHVPESGFDIYSDDNREPFLTLINGKTACPPQTIPFTVYNAFEEKVSLNIECGELAPYETHLMYPAREFPLSAFLKNRPGCCKINFHLKDVFPRLLVGNQLKKPFATVITHSYYDCKEAEDPSNFWIPSDPKWHAASLMLPFLGKGHQTALSFYPIFARSAFAIDLEIYTKEGHLLGTFKDTLVCMHDFDHFEQLKLHELYPSDDMLAVRIIARALENTPIPARIKIGIDVGIKDIGLPCNICTNLQPYVPAFTDKKTSFKWAPILSGQPKNYAFLMNSSPKKTMEMSATLELTFFREKDTETLKRHLILPPQGFLYLNPDEDPELAAFLDGKTGWFTAITSNPYLTTYYFTENPLSGVIGADHGY